MDRAVDQLIELLRTKGVRQYGGERVSQCEHALQCASLAARANAPAALIAAALLHDIGHLLHEEGEQPALRGVDDRHEQIGAEYLLPAFGPAVAEPVRLHVPAKRYLCATDPGYYAAIAGLDAQPRAARRPLYPGRCRRVPRFALRHGGR